MGENSWPEFRTDITAARGHARAHVTETASQVPRTRSELVAEVEQLSTRLDALSAAFETKHGDGETGGHDRQLDEQQREEVTEQIHNLAAHVKSCVANQMRLEQEVDQRIGEAEVGVGDSIAQIQAHQREIVDEVIDLRSLQVEFGDLQVETIEENQRISKELRAEIAKTHDRADTAIHEAASAAASYTALQAEFDAAQVTSADRMALLRARIEQNVDQRIGQAELRVADSILEIQTDQREIVNAVIDLRSLQAEFGDQEFDTITDSGRLRQELINEAATLRAMVEESRELVDKANYQASAASANNDALQAEFDAAQVESERRLELLQSLIEQVDRRSHERAQTTNSFVADTANQTNTKIAEVGAVVTERDRRHVSSTDAVANRIRELEGRIKGLEKQSVDVDPPPAQQPSLEQALPVSGLDPKYGWRFERRSERLRNRGQ